MIGEYHSSNPIPNHTVPNSLFQCFIDAIIEIHQTQSSEPLLFDNKKSISRHIIALNFFFKPVKNFEITSLDSLSVRPPKMLMFAI